MAAISEFAIPVLCYHSWRIESPEYPANDHVALQQDLATLKQEHFRLLSIERLVSALRDGSASEQFGDEKLVCVTFDDGFLYDVEDMRDPELGLIPSFETILRRDEHIPERFDEGSKAVSFVIASKDARENLRHSSDPKGYWDLRDDWWPKCARGDAIAIGNHSWDHTHPDLAQVRQREGKKGSFLAVDNADDARVQVLEAQSLIDQLTQGHALKIFCYPYGDVPEFLQYEFMPTEGAAAGMLAAFGTDKKLVTSGSDIWNLPRLVCGQHWRDSSDLLPLIKSLT